MTSQLLLYTQPRSGSHLLERMLEGQLNCTPFLRLFEDGWHHHIIEWLRRDDYANGMPADANSKYEDDMHSGIKEWQEELSKAQQVGTILMVHTHSFFPASAESILKYTETPRPQPSPGENFTLVPDSLLCYPGTVPILTIRNPRLAVPSAYKAMQNIIPDGDRPNLQLLTNLIWTRLLYDYYEANSIEPLVVDADDYMTSESFVKQLCSKAGLNPEQATLAWSPTTEQEKDGLQQPYVAVQTTLMGSTAANPGRAAKNLNLDDEEKKWKEEFGEKLPLIQELVQLAMPHYEYLYERRLRF